ncbi:YdcH family protein [Caldovatus aquaticus]|uniref:YdcH family protein n=1 Tax=Caldovatus aquaticus TaxID=2865671 RepID=A0ABS7F5T1_9PROT|nr:YdcH family protein [Caldovatus aquaticus]MBW8270978.1 YdcH family protein [Caldovatus aquaticus]
MPDAPLLARIRALEERHEALERRLAEEEARPRPDPDALHRLKREKLRLRDAIARLRREG